MSSVLIGQIVNVHGIKGEVKIYPYTDDIDILCKRLKNIYLDELEDDSYYIKDLIGLDVIDINADEVIGTLEYVFNTGANDIYEVKRNDGSKVYLPAIKQVIKKVDIKARKIYVEIMEGLI